MTEPSARRDQRILELIEADKIPKPNHEALANLYRRNGNLPAAAREYDRLRAHGFVSPEVELFQSVFHQKRVPDRYPTTAFAPAPFVLFNHFLDRVANQALLDESISKQANFTQTEINKLDPTGKTGRTNLVNYDVGVAGELMRVLVAEKLPLICERLNVPNIALKFIHLKLASYLHGDFFHAHQDNGHNHPDRKISFVYYFHREPKPYQGGDLLLYDTRMAPCAYVRSLYTRIIPQNNDAIFFPSEYFHEVVPVESSNRHFASSRFTMAGHIG